MKSNLFVSSSQSIQCLSSLASSCENNRIPMNDVTWSDDETWSDACYVHSCTHVVPRRGPVLYRKQILFAARLVTSSKWWAALIVSVLAWPFSSCDSLITHEDKGTRNMWQNITCRWSKWFPSTYTSAAKHTLTSNNCPLNLRARAE